VDRRGREEATFPDTAALTALSTGDAAALLPDLFPADQIAARDSYVEDLLMRFDIHPIARPKIITAQLAACTQWMAGGDPDGAKLGAITARTLVGGGELDGLLPVANQRHLAHAIPHAKLVTYPDAAHGFFSQEAADFVPQLGAFLR
jgi:pimeloyl-ACP methyl ester carboxylesterase